MTISLTIAFYEKEASFLRGRQKEAASRAAASHCPQKNGPRSPLYVRKWKE